MLFLCVGSENRSGPKKLDSFFRVFKCTVASGYAALTSDFRLYNTPSGVDYQVPVGTLFVEVAQVVGGAVLENAPIARSAVGGPVHGIPATRYAKRLRTVSRSAEGRKERIARRKRRHVRSIADLRRICLSLLLGGQILFPQIGNITYIPLLKRPLLPRKIMNIGAGANIYDILS